MSEILASGCPIVIQLIISLLILGEIWSFTEKSIYFDFNDIEIKNISIKSKPFKDFIRNIQQGSNNQKIPLLIIFNAFHALNFIKKLSYLILVISCFAFLICACDFLGVLEEKVNSSLIVKISWVILFILDVFLVIKRGLSKICLILHAFHSKYKKIATARIILYMYMFK